jgi:hypothetical protein
MRLRFTIRDLLWLAAVVALAARARYSNMALEIRHLKMALEVSQMRHKMAERAQPPKWTTSGE